MEEVPAANCAAALRFRDIFGYVVCRGVSVTVQLYRCTESNFPIGQIINGVPFIRMARVHKATGIRIAQAMEMDCTILMELRNGNVSQPVPAYSIVQPLAEFFNGSLIVISINELLVQRDRKE